MKTTTLFCVMIGLAGCGNHDRSRENVASAQPALARATQTDLARELADADHHGTWTAVRHRWQGQRLHWTVTRQRLFCQTADACHVAAFPVQRPARQGWLPALAFAPGEFAKVVAACGSAEQCDLEIEGTLAELDVSPEMPTHMKLSDVQVSRAAPI